MFAASPNWLLIHDQRTAVARPGRTINIPNGDDREMEEQGVSNIDGPQNIREETYVEPVARTVVQPGAVVQQPVVQPAAVVQQPVAEPVVGGQVVSGQVVGQTVVTTAPAVSTASVRRFAPDAIIAAVVGLVLLVVGLLAIVRGGFDGPMEDPIVEVLGFTHTTTLGLIEAVLGTCLLIAGASSWRSGALFFGSILAIGGFIGAVQTESFVTSLALESSHAWIAAIAGAVVVASALLMPRYLTRTTEVRTVGSIR
jgi:hypothetical protein